MTSNQNIGTVDRTACESSHRMTSLSFTETLHRTYAELAWRVRRLAHQLRALGVNRADRVGWLGPNHPAFLEIFFATAKIGAVVAPINHRLERRAIEAICDRCGPPCRVPRRIAVRRYASGAGRGGGDRRTRGRPGEPVPND